MPVIRSAFLHIQGARITGMICGYAEALAPGDLRSPA